LVLVLVLVLMLVLVLDYCFYFHQMDYQLLKANHLCFLDHFV
jgi:hypothetical protein